MRLMGMGIPELFMMLCYFLIPILVIVFVGYFVVRKAVFDALVKYHQEVENKQP